MEPTPSQPISPEPPLDEAGAPQQHTAGQVFAPGGAVTPPPPPIDPMPAPASAIGVTSSPELPTPNLAPVPPITSSDSPIPSAESFTASPIIVSANTISESKSRSKMLKGPIAIIAIALFVLLGGGAAAYFGYIVPNQPDKVWAKALVNSGKGYDKLADYATKQLSGTSKGIKIDGTYKLTGSLALDGAFSGSSDGENGEFTGSLSATGVKVNLDTRVIKSSGNSPDIYFKLDGLKGIGTLFGGAGSQYESALNGIDGTWYFVDHTLFDQFAQGANTNLQVSQQDVSSILKAVGDASKQNIFTSDTSKMVFSVKQNVGKEKQDGRSVYHYKAGVNKDNLKVYVKTLCTNLKNSNLKKFFNGDANQMSSSIGCDNTDKSLDGYSNSGVADVWVDLHTKLIHKIRFTDANNKDSYFDVGQDYQGGDTIPFSMNFHDKSDGVTSNGTINLTLNMKTNVLTFKATGQDSGADSVGGSLEFSVSPNTTTVKVDKPANAKTLIELLNDLGAGDLLGADGSIGGSAADTERKTDINALHGQIEAYQAQNGIYPTLANINSSIFRAANMKGLDDAALQDPAGSAGVLLAAPAAHAYSYAALPAGCDNVTKDCTDYTLTATLEDGSTYAKQALNFDSSTPSTVLN